MVNKAYTVAAGAGLLAAAAAGVIAGSAGGAAGEQSAKQAKAAEHSLYEELRTRTPLIEGVTVTTSGDAVTTGAKLPAGSKIKFDAVPAGSTVSIASSAGDVDTLQRDSDTWITDRLAPGQTYTLTATAIDGSSASWQVVTRDAKNPYSASVNLNGGTWGVAAPLIVNFDTDVKNKEDVLEALTVTADTEVGDIAWVWQDDNTVVGRGEDFWPADTTFTIEADLTGVQARNNVWGSPVTATWNTGSDTRIITNFDNHTMTVKRNGKTIATMPTSGGKSGWETATGIKPVSEKYEVKRLYNPGPDGWDVTVPWAMRLTYSGEFIHSAPWNGSIGYANTSHGCTNLTVSDAADVFSSTRIGDPVISRGGNGQPVQPWDTWGGAWAYTWDEWVSNAYLTDVTRN